MNLYDKASLILTTNAYSASVVYALKPGTSATDFTYTRPGSGSRINSAGQFETVKANIPRLTYYSGSLCPGWYQENNRTNQIPNSLMTSGSGVGIAPYLWSPVVAGDGTYYVTSSIYGNLDGASAYAFVVTTASNYSTIHPSSPLVTVSSNVYIGSVYVESVTNNIRIVDIILPYTAALNSQIGYTINGVPVSLSTNITPAMCPARVTMAISGTNGIISAMHMGAGAQLSTLSQGPTTVVLSRPQFEAIGVTEWNIISRKNASSFIPTLNASASRGSDVMVGPTNTGNIIFGAGAGSIYLEGVWDTNDQSYQTPFTLNSATILYFAGASNGKLGWGSVGYPTIFAQNSYNEGTKIKTVITWSDTHTAGVSGSVVFYFNGVKTKTVATTPLTPTFSDTSYKCIVSTGPNGTKISNIIAFPSALTDAEAIALTTL